MARLDNGPAAEKEAEARKDQEAEASKEREAGASNEKGAAYVQIKTAKEAKKTKAPRLSWALARAYGGTFLMGATVKLFHDVLLFVSPMLLR